jgi:CRISPR-associated protein Cas2
MRTTYLVCYDISDDKRLRSVNKKMRGYGDHLQFSIFECQFTSEDLAHCRAELGEIIDHKADQVIFVGLGPADGRGALVITALGKPYLKMNSPSI